MLGVLPDTVYHSLCTGVPTVTQLLQRFTETGVCGSQWVVAQRPVEEVFKSMLESATTLHLSMGEILALLLVSGILPATKTLAQVGAQCICSFAY